jgi:hypothetical protein
MPLIKGRFDDLSREELLDILRELEGPFLELELSLDGCAGDPALVLQEVFFVLHGNPRLQLLFPTRQEYDDWERFKDQHGNGVKAIGDFVYGRDENPWRRKSHP